MSVRYRTLRIENVLRSVRKITAVVLFWKRPQRFGEISAGAISAPQANGARPGRGLVPHTLRSRVEEQHLWGDPVGILYSLYWSCSQPACGTDDHRSCMGHFVVENRRVI